MHRQKCNGMDDDADDNHRDTVKPPEDTPACYVRTDMY